MSKALKMATPVLSSILAVSMLAACSSNNASDPSQPPSSSEPKATEKAEALQGALVSKNPIELTIHLKEGNIVFKDEWPVFKKAAEWTNVTLKGELPAHTADAKEAFNLMVASNDFADIVKTSKANFDKFGMEGAFVPLNDLIKQHAPNLSKFLDANAEMRKIATAPDGKIYYIPFKPDGEASTGWFIREDWLTKLGLQKPKTVDEYYNVLKAFKEKDPNGNGKADEVPYFHGATGYGVYYLLNLWDSNRDFHIKDGKVVFGGIQPEYKTAMTNLAKWYKEGLIDKEIFTRGGKAREVLLGENLGGSTHDWFGSTAGFNNTVKVPEFKFIPIAPLASITGVVRETDFRATVKDQGWGISSQNKNPIETIKYFDFFFTEEGRKLMNYGVEGQTYTLENGKPKFTKELLGKNVVTTLKEQYGAQIEIGFHQDFEYEKQWMDPIALQGAEEYISKGYIQRIAFPNMAYTVEEQNKIKELRGAIETFRDETGQKWLLGAESVEAGFDKYTEQIKAMKVDELLNVFNTAYQRYLKE